MVAFQGEEANSDAKSLIQEVKVGGIIYYNWANRLHCSKQALFLSKELQLLSKTPLLISIDQEGGRVQRLKTSSFPSNKEGKDRADEIAFQIGTELRNVGINMNLAPVIDVNSNPSNPVIGDRAFSSDPWEVAVCGRKALSGYKKSGVIATLKHFPGHGDTSMDSHVALPVLDKSMDELEKTELIPFRELSPIADAIMTAHILVPALDPEFPVTLSKKWLDFLRKELGFQGVIISDSLVMDGVLEKAGSIDEAAILAINAGCDLLIFGGAKLLGVDHCLNPDKIKSIQCSICKAVVQGRIPIE